jgi:membrane-associated phospholipid phosphatase
MGCRAAASAGTFAVALAVATTARADPSPSRRRAIHAAVVIGTGALFTVASTTLGDRVAPETCRWCEPPGFDRSLRDALRWNDVGGADTTSDALGYVGVPAVGLGLLAASSQSGTRWIDDALPVVESMLVSSLVTAGVKIGVARQRPFVHFADPATHVPDTGDNLSFFSGHTSLAFSIAVSSGVVASRRGYRLAPLVWAGGLTFAAATGYLRIAADKHYASDVFVGALVGSAAGIAIPIWLHDLCVVPARNGIAITGSW